MKRLIKDYKALLPFFVSLIFNAIFLFYIVSTGFVKNHKTAGNNNEAARLADKNGHELENRYFTLDRQYNELKEKYNKLEKSGNELQQEYKKFKKDALTRINGSNNSSLAEIESLDNKGRALQDEFDRYRKNISEIVQYLNDSGQKTEDNEPDAAFIMRCIKYYVNESERIKNLQAVTKNDELKNDRIIDTLFSFSDINGIITGRRSEDIIINNSKVDYILKNATFITYQSDRDHATGIIEVTRVNNVVKYKIIKGNVNEKDFF